MTVIEQFLNAGQCHKSSPDEGGVCMKGGRVGETLATMAA